jgi:hypothetical protein
MEPTTDACIVETSCTVPKDVAVNLHDFFGPAQIDQTIRHAIQFCWMSLPKSRRTAEELEKQIRRLVDRALRDFREDQQAFAEEKPS